MSLLKSLFGAVTHSEKPLHAGEVMTLWSVTLALAEGRVLLQTFANHVADADLKKFLEQYVSDFEAPWIDRFQQFMLKESIPLPSQTPDKPAAEQREIPSGARFTDTEVAHLVASKLIAGLDIIHQGSLTVLRYDLGTMLLELQAATFKQAFMLRELMELRGWLQVPPYWPVIKPDQQAR